MTLFNIHMKRKLFCESSPFAYQLSRNKNIILRKIKDAFSDISFAKIKSNEKLPFVIYEHQSQIKRVLGNVDMTLQENKKTNLSLTAPKINGILIYPGETFSFWHLAGNCTARKGYKEGLVISNSKTKSGIGGGMCQFTNLIHWMVLHSPLEIVEHHHHDGFDLFPDSFRKVPFGTGTSIAYNYLDYRVKNTTDNVFQLMVYVNDTHLCGELRSLKPDGLYYIIETEGECFVKKEDGIYRKGKVYRTCINRDTGDVIKKECIRINNAKVMYDTKNLEIKEE